jgi:hypothetical protein
VRRRGSRRCRLQWSTSFAVALQSSDGHRRRPVRHQRRGCLRGLGRRDRHRRGPPVGSMVGASAVAATAVRLVAAAACQSTVGDDLAVAVATLCRSTSVGASAVRLGWELGSSTVGTVVGAATCSFVVVVPSGRRLVDPVVDPHEVCVFSELGDDLSSAYALSLTCDRCDRHKALLRGGMYPAPDRLESFRKVADGEVVSEPPASFVTLPVSLASSVPLVGVSSAGASAVSSSEEMSSRYRF